MLVGDFTIYNFSSFAHNTVRKFLFSTLIITSFAKYKWIVLIACIWSHLQVFSSIVASLSLYMRVSISPCLVSISFTLACQRKNLFFQSNRSILNLIVPILSIFFDLDQSRTIEVLISVIMVSIILIPIIGTNCTDTTLIGGSLMENTDLHS